MDTRQLAKYQANNGNDITLTDTTIRRYLCDNVNVSDKEVMLFAALCKGNKLDPFNREAYLVKYGDRPATMIVSKDVFVKRAQANPRFRGFQAGVNVISADGQRLVEREGSLVLQGETIVGGWCRVYIDGYEHPMFESVSLNEYNTGKSNWAKMPATMIRKVAVTHALREAFPEDLGGLYESAEMGSEEIPSQTVETTEEAVEVISTATQTNNTNVIADAEFIEVEPDLYPEAAYGVPEYF